MNEVRQTLDEEPQANQIRFLPSHAEKTASKHERRRPEWLFPVRTRWCFSV